MEKVTIYNRKKQKIVVLPERNENQKGLVFVSHGLGGFKEQMHIAAIGEAFKEKDFTVVRFDTTNNVGESEGRYEDGTFTSYYEDLEDVIAWASSQSWYSEPFFLSGHSLGGMTSILYAEKYPAKVKGLVPVSAAISGKLSFEAHGKKYMDNWKTSGWRVHASVSKPGLI